MLDLTSHTAVPTTFILNEEGKLMASISTTTEVTLVPSCIPPPSASLKVSDSAEEVLSKLMDLRVLRALVLRKGVVGVVGVAHG